MFFLLLGTALLAFVSKFQIKSKGVKKPEQKILVGSTNIINYHTDALNGFPLLKNGKRCLPATEDTLQRKYTALIISK